MKNELESKLVCSLDDMFARSERVPAKRLRAKVKFSGKVSKLILQLAVTCLNSRFNINIFGVFARDRSSCQ